MHIKKLHMPRCEAFMCEYKEIIFLELYTIYIFSQVIGEIRSVHGVRAQLHRETSPPAV